MDFAIRVLEAVASRLGMDVGEFGLGRPEALYLLLILPAWWLVVWPWAGSGVLFSGGESARRTARWKVVPYGFTLLLLPLVLRALGMISLVVALAEPQLTERTSEIAKRGKGIGLLVDLSTSMLAKDMGNG
jgi:hypothetical protein